MVSRRLSLAVLSLLLLSGVTVALAQSANAQTLSVAISSPGSGAVFNRGEVATITAKVTLAGSPVSGAEVSATDPTGGQIFLSSTPTPGTYSVQYEVQASDPVGAWTINVEATSGGQAASAHTSVSVSDSLLVSVVSPPAGSVFNVGETATVEATVTYQDGSRLPPSAAVDFANPSGVAVPMALASADSSGKTWTGTYTILASDVPADGVTWPITVSAAISGNAGSSVRSVSLFKTLLVGVSTFGSSTFTTPQTDFQIGQTVYVKAAVTLHDGTTVSSGAVYFTITGTTIFSTSMPMTYVLPMSAWTGSYTFQPTDQQGAQTVTVTAADSKGNTGSGSQHITVGVQGLSVSITSPASGSSFNRGQTLTISASVAAAGSPATSATVTANSPSGGTITLVNQGSGTYAAPYTILSTDPTGTWTITVQATQGGLSGSDQVAVTIGVPPTSQALEAIITLNPSTHNIGVSAVCNTTAGCVGPTTITNSSTSTHGGHGDGEGDDHGQGQGSGQGNGQGSGQGQDQGAGQGQGHWMGGATLFTFVIKDTAGHSLTLNMSLQGDGNHVMASVLSIQYGTAAAPITAESNRIGFDLANGWGGWGDMTTFTEWASVNGTSYLGQFDAQNDTTTITTRADGQPGTNTTSSGLWLFELATTDGALSVNPVPVSAASTTTSVSCTAAQSDQHGSRGNSGVWCTATVTGNDPTGTVNWSSSVTTGQFMPPSCQLDQNGTCTVRYIQGSAGTATVTASYSGDGFDGPSSGTATVTTAPPTPGTSITTISCRVVEQQPGTSGLELRCNAYVYGKNPSGTVTWSSSSSGTFSSTTCTLGSGGGDSGSRSWPQGDQCQVTYTQTSAGTVTISASYSGDQNNLPSSASVTLSIM